MQKCCQKILKTFIIVLLSRDISVQIRGSIPYSTSANGSGIRDAGLVKIRIRDPGYTYRSRNTGRIIYTEIANSQLPVLHRCYIGTVT